MHHALRSSVTAALAAALAVTPLGARAESNVPVTLRTGQSVLVATPRLTRVAVGDGKIAGVLAVGNSEIVINGRSAGRTTLLVWTNGARRTFDVTVTEQSLASLKAMLQGAIPDRDVHVDAYDHSLVLNGTVAGEWLNVSAGFASPPDWLGDPMAQGNLGLVPLISHTQVESRPGEVDLVLADLVSQEPAGGSVMLERNRQPAGQAAQP